jgi:hypothetical protein
LQVGGTSTDGSDALFYANIKDPTVKIAGWNVTSTGLYSGLSNGVPSIYLGSTGIKAPIDKTVREGLVLKAGTNFGVTADGTLYCVNGNFSGNITGSIITGGSINIGNGKCIIDKYGNITLKGGIKLLGDITWGSDGPGGGGTVTAEVNIDSIRGALEGAEAQDGIYNENGYICVNASAIKTGYI